MACGLPFVIAAQFAYPSRQCVAFVGDGGFTMLMGEFATAVKYKLPIKVVVLKNDNRSAHIGIRVPSSRSLGRVHEDICNTRTF